MNVFSCPLQVQPLFRDHVRVSHVPAGGNLAVCVVCPLAIVGALLGVHEQLLGRRELLLGGRELLLVLFVEEVGVLRLVVVVVVVGASPMLKAVPARIMVGVEVEATTTTTTTTTTTVATSSCSSSIISSSSSSSSFTTTTTTTTTARLLRLVLRLPFFCYCCCGMATTLLRQCLRGLLDARLYLLGLLLLLFRSARAP